MSRIAALMPVGLFLAIAGTLGLSLLNDPRKMPSTLIDKPVPRFELDAVAGTERGLSSEALMSEVTLLNVYASWCPGCRVEHPNLMRIAQSRRIALYGLNWKDKPDDGGRWLKQHGNPYIAVGNDPSGRTGIDMGVTGVPETFVIDREGRIRYRHAGPITEDVFKDVFEPLLVSLGSHR